MKAKKQAKTNQLVFSRYLNMENRLSENMNCAFESEHQLQEKSAFLSILCMAPYFSGK